MFFGVAYYPEHWPEENWARDAKNIRECGMDGVRIGEFSWSRLEPGEGKFDLDWLERAINILGKAGLKVIIGTPTATPPSWLVHKYPEILPINANGVQMKSGVRKYYCHTNKLYRHYAKNIATKLAQRFGDNPHVIGWQVDNELGDHDTVRCYCNSCRNKFIIWCEAKYKSLDQLNDAWGTVFWSQQYSDWKQIDLPYPRKEIGLNPSHLLDYYRFTSDQVIEFCENQVLALRKHISGEQWVTTNVIATYWEINFQKLAKILDFISWDCYTVIDATSPIRFPKVGPSPPISFPPRYEMISFVHDMMRSFSDKPFWVMETAGQDRLVSYHTIAHGGEGVNFFRWKGSRFGAEQSRGGYEYHGIFSNRFHENKKISSELHRITDLLSKTKFSAQVGLFYSFDMGWAYDINYIYPRSVWIDGVGYWRLMEEYYTSFWKKNISIQPVSADDDFSNFKVLIIPCLYLTTPEINNKLINYVADGGTLIVGPASGTKDWNNLYLEGLPPDGKLKNLFDCQDHDKSIGCMYIGADTVNVKEIFPKITPDRAHFGTREDALERVKLANDNGLIMVIGRLKLESEGMGVPDTGHFMTVCFCCPCCCINGKWRYGTTELQNILQRIEGVNVKVDEDLCVGCEECLNVCVFNGMEMIDGTARVNQEICLGCGRCERVCQTGAITITLDDPKRLDEFISRIEANVDVS